MQDVSLVGGEDAAFMLSGRPHAEGRIRLARLVHGDANPAGPGYHDESVDWGQPESLVLDQQLVDFGSYLEIPDAPALHPRGSFTVAVWIYPTLVTSRWHAIAARSSPADFGFGIYCAGGSFLTAGISHDGHAVTWCTGPALIERLAWQLVVLVCDLEAGVFRLDFCARSDGRVRCGPPRKMVGPVNRSAAPLLFGACLDPSPTSRLHWGHFNGKLARPMLLDRALAEDDVCALANDGHAEYIADALGAWDLSREVTGDRVVDVSRNANHGRAVNMPARAVTGPSWRGVAASSFTENSDSYDAVHLHDDDLDDAGWAETFAVPVPENARSGIYAVFVDLEEDRLVLPFVVKEPKAVADIGLLVPTLTWQAYNTNRLIYAWTEDGVLDPGVSIYNAHEDGSMSYYSTRRRPTRSWHPTAGVTTGGAHALTADLYLVDWLEKQGYEYDTFSDEHLHRDGLAALDSYRAVILSSHPEYCTRTMLDALHRYVRAGGRVLYLGGNGLYWVTSLDAQRPWVLEVRKSEGAEVRPWSVDPDGEWLHSTTLELGGLWSRRGIPPRSLLGVEYAGNVFDEAEGRWGFHRLEASWDPRLAFVFEGVQSEVIGDFGLNLGSAASVEIDAVQPWVWPDGQGPVILARASHEAFGRLGTVAAAPVADLAFTAFPGGGAVFAVGSIGWTGSLSHSNYANDVSTITGNVLRRFLSVHQGEEILET
jgi:N,N-dimethylformamidase